MKTVIIDNESKIREALKKLLEIYCPSVTLVGEANGCASGKELIESVDPELIFVDIEMDDGLGTDLIRSISGLKGHVVFITAHDKYAVDAFKCSALDFLLKPIDPEELIAALEKARLKRTSIGLQKQIEVLEGHLSRRNNEDAKIVLSDSESIHLINIREILWCCAEGSYTLFVLENGSKILVSKNLKSYEEFLDEKSFIRIHHSYLVNVNHIKRFERNEGGTLVMDNGATLPVSVRKKDNLMQVLKKWNQNTLIK